MKKTTITLLLSSLIATGVNADCNDDTDNLMQNANCDFTDNTTNWSIFSGSGNISHNAGDDFLLGGSAGSANVIGTSAGLSFTSSIQSACVSVPDTTLRTAGIWIKGDPTVTLNCSVTSFDFSDNNCMTGGGILAGTGGFLVAPGAPWASYNYPFQPGMTTSSTYMRVLCSNQNQFEYGIDNAYISQDGSTPVELQSFSVE